MIDSCVCACICVSVCDSVSMMSNAYAVRYIDKFSRNFRHLGLAITSLVASTKLLYTEPG